MKSINFSNDNEQLKTASANSMFSKRRHFVNFDLRLRSIQSRSLHFLD